MHCVWYAVNKVISQKLLYWSSCCVIDHKQEAVVPAGRLKPCAQVLEVQCESKADGLYWMFLDTFS